MRRLQRPSIPTGLSAVSAMPLQNGMIGSQECEKGTLAITFMQLVRTATQADRRLFLLLNFFHIFDGSTMLGPEEVEIPSLRAAQQLALGIVADLLPVVAAGFCDGEEERKIDATDDAGTVQFTLRLSLTSPKS